MQIESSDSQCENAEAPIAATLDSDSNATVERDVHRQKLCWPSISTDDGSAIDYRDEHIEKAELPMHERLD
jgi:hypothetical protein